jgi:transposase
VIGPTGAVRVIGATRPVDFRKGAGGLAALVREEMKADPFCGAIYVFRPRRADRVKLVFWDGTGCACSRSVLRRASSAGPPTPFLIAERARIPEKLAKQRSRCIHLELPS